MKCPVCKTPDLVMSDRQGVEIDYCPQCRGVWLDRGELDKILDRSQQELAASRPQAPPAARSRSPHDSDIYPAQYGGHKRHKKKHWLMEIFD